MRIAFFGTPEFAVPSLRSLLRERYQVVGVVTQPDRPQGRSRSALVAPPVKVEAERAGIPVLQPVRPLGERRHDSNHAVGVGIAQRPEELANLSPDAGNLGGMEIAVAGDGHHQRHGIAALARSTRGAPRRRGERNLLDLTGG